MKEKNQKFVNEIKSNLKNKYNLNNSEIEEAIKKSTIVDLVDRFPENIMKKAPEQWAEDINIFFSPKIMNIKEAISDDIESTDIDDVVVKFKSDLLPKKNKDIIPTSGVEKEPVYEDIVFDDDYDDYELDEVKPKKEKSKIFKSIKTRVIAASLALIAVAGVITATLHFNKKQKANTPKNNTSVSDNTSIPANNDDLNVKVNLKKQEQLPKTEGFIDSDKVVIDSNGEAWVSKEDEARKGDIGTKYEKGYVANDGNVYESKEELNKQKDVGKTTYEDNVYEATDGTLFSTAKERDIYNKSLQESEKYYEATDGTLFSTAKERDTYNELLENGIIVEEETVITGSSNKSKTEQDETISFDENYDINEDIVYEATDGTAFYTPEERDSYNESLKNGEQIKENVVSSSVSLEELYRIREEILSEQNETIEQKSYQKTI